MSKVKQKECLLKAKQEITFLENQQLTIYENVCELLETEDNEGFVWDYVFGNSSDNNEVLREINRQ
jgi:hypothetical protein